MSKLKKKPTTKNLLEDRDTLIDKAEQAFVKSMKVNNIKRGTKTYLKMQAAFFQGAASVLGGEFPARWGVNLISGREIDITERN